MAKIDNYKDLKTHKTKNIFLLLGPDTGSKETYIKKIISNIEPEYGETPAVTRQFPHELELIDFVANLRNRNLFNSHQVVILQEIQDIPSGNGRKSLIDYCNNPSTSSTLILTSPYFQDSISSTLVKLIPKTHTKIFFELFPDAKARWISRYFQPFDIQIDRSAVELILECITGDTSELEIVCNNIRSFVGSKSLVTSATIENILYYNKEENILTLFNCIAKRDLNTSLLSLSRLLLSSHNPPIYIIGGLLRQFEALAELKTLQSQKFSNKELFEKMTSMKIKSARLKKTILEASTLYDENETNQINGVLTEYDCRIRLFSQEFHEQLLQLLIYHIVTKGGRGVLQQFEN